MFPNPIIWNIHPYGVMIAVGVMLAVTVLFLYGPKMNLDSKFLDFLFYNTIASVMVGMGSAALFQSIYNYIENPQAGFHFGSGMTFIGGLIGGSVCFLSVYFIFRKRLTRRLVDMLTLAPCAITVAHGCGRIGCFFAGCCYGKPTDSVFGVKFPRLAVKVHPTQLYEAAFLFALCAILSFLLLKKKFRHNLSVYLIAYGIFRFCLEFVRNDHRGELVAGLSPSQFWSILMIVIGIALIPTLKYFHRQRDAELAAASAGNPDAAASDNSEERS